MRILVWAAFFLPHVGGYEKNVLELSRRLVGRGYQVDVVTCQTGNSPATEVIDGVGIKRIPSLLLLNKLYPVPLPSKMLLDILLGRRSYNVVITQTRFFVLSLIGAVFSMLYRIPLVHVERGSRHTVTSNPIVGLASKIYDHTIGYWIMRRAKRVIGVSETACGFARHLGARGVTRVPNGVADNGSAVSTANSILYVGRLIRAKGVQDLIDAYKQLNEEFPLIVVGDGPYRRHLQEIAGGGNNIQFLGELFGERLNSVYHLARVFVNPSYSEGLPTAVMEAAASGVPVIATNVGGTGEILGAGTTGLLVKPGDVDGMKQAISWVLNHEEEAKEIAETCKERVLEVYSWDRVVDQYCELLRGLYTKKQILGHRVPVSQQYRN